MDQAELGDPPDSAGIKGASPLLDPVYFLNFKILLFECMSAIGHMWKSGTT